MQITWLGQSSFKIEAKTTLGNTVTIITDPYNDSVGLKMPRSKADIVTVSHGHFDHNNLEAVKGEPFIIQNPGEYETKGVFIYGVETYHDDKKGAERGPSTVYRIDVEDLTLAHLGDLGHTLENGQLELLEGVDILMIPVGGVYTIDAKKAMDVISQIEPRIVLPMHYKIPGIKVNFDGIDKFCKEIGVCSKDHPDKLKITKKDLPQEDMQVIVLERQG